MAVIWLILAFTLGHLISKHSFKFLYLFRKINIKNAFYTSLKVPNKKAFFTSVVKPFLNSFKNYFYLTVNHYKRLFFMSNQNILGLIYELA